MPRAAAFFDLDRTLVPCNTGHLFVADLRRRGELSLLFAARAVGWLAQYHFALLDLPATAARVAMLFKGRAEDEFAERCQRWVEDQVLPRLLPDGLRRIEQHRDQGEFLAILSTSPSYVVKPVAHSLGFDGVGCTMLEVQGGLFTGRLLGPTCYGAGKVHWAETMGREHLLDIDRSWFYTDSYTDLPMLERVANRVVINPDPRLRRAARQRGWPIEWWRSQVAAPIAA